MPHQSKSLGNVSTPRFNKLSHLRTQSPSYTHGELRTISKEQIRPTREEGPGKQKKNQNPQKEKKTYLGGSYVLGHDIKTTRDGPERLLHHPRGNGATRSDARRANSPPLYQGQRFRIPSFGVSQQSTFLVEASAEVSHPMFPWATELRRERGEKC